MTDMISKAQAQLDSYQALADENKRLRELCQRAARVIRYEWAGANMTALYRDLEAAAKGEK